jgi:DNA-binding transcriptional LysR family regulator
MKNAVTLLLVVLAVPVVAYFASTALIWHQDSQVRSELLQSYQEKKETPPDTLDSLTVAHICTNPKIASDPSLADMCDTNRTLGTMQLLAVAAAGLGIGLLALIAITGRLARGRRRVLLAFFGPGLHLTMLALIRNSLLRRTSAG